MAVLLALEEILIGEEIYAEIIWVEKTYCNILCAMKQFYE